MGGTTVTNVVIVLDEFFELFGMDNKVGFHSGELHKTVGVQGQGRVWDVMVFGAERHCDGRIWDGEGEMGWMQA